MAKRPKRRSDAPQSDSNHGKSEWDRLYRNAMNLAEKGQYEKADHLLAKLLDNKDQTAERLLDVENDRAVLSVLMGRHDDARERFAAILHRDPLHANAWLNLRFIDGNRGIFTSRAEFGLTDQLTPLPKTEVEKKKRITVVSLLFHWPSDSFPNNQTVDLIAALSQADFEVQHITARYEPWGIGKIDHSLPFQSQTIEFTEADWNSANIRDRFGKAVAAFNPDFVVITDSWSFKPHLALAVEPFPTVLVFQGMECLCPLNNIRYLPSVTGQTEPRQCFKNQLATPQTCVTCVQSVPESWTSPLQRQERQLSGFGSPEYDGLLRKSLENAHAVIASDPVIESMLAPFAKRTVVVPNAIAADRFVWPPPEKIKRDKIRLLYPGPVGETNPGLPTLENACKRLREKRQDFELLRPGGSTDIQNDYTTPLGSLDRDSWTTHYQQADVCVVSAVTQESFSRLGVEAMAAGLPVVASRIGDMPYSVLDGVTGLLFEPGNALDLAAKIEQLLDNPELRTRMGRAGRHRFAEQFTWATILKQLKPLWGTSHAASP